MKTRWFMGVHLNLTKTILNRHRFLNCIVSEMVKLTVTLSRMSQILSRNKADLILVLTQFPITAFDVEGVVLLF